MTINETTEIFAGLPVVDYSTDDGIKDPDNKAYRISVDYDDAEDGVKATEILKAFLNDPEAGKIKALIIGSWEEAFDESCENILKMLVDKNDCLGSLKALFVGDMTYEECEISWITQGDYKGIINAFPKLEELRVRGSNDLRLNGLNHKMLKKLVIECGGLPSEVIGDVIAGSLPELEHLELWLGTDNYGFGGSWDTIAPLLEIARFPNLNYLGLRDSEIADDLAVNIAGHPILDQIDILDLSLGTLTDKGAQALLDNNSIEKLTKMDLHHHFLSDEMMTKLKNMSGDIDISRQNEAEDYGDGDIYRYVAVSE